MRTKKESRPTLSRRQQKKLQRALSKFVIQKYRFLVVHASTHQVPQKRLFHDQPRSPPLHASHSNPLVESRKLRKPQRTRKQPTTSHRDTSPLATQHTTLVKPNTSTNLPTEQCSQTPNTPTPTNPATSYSLTLPPPTSSHTLSNHNPLDKLPDQSSPARDQISCLVHPKWLLRMAPEGKPRDT